MPSNTENFFKSLLTDEQKAYEEVFEEQLRFTSDVILAALTEHPHYTDDCGDELMSALDLSLRMAMQRSNGIEEFVKFMDRAKAGEEEDFNDEQFASVSDAASKFFGWEEDL